MSGTKWMKDKIRTLSGTIADCEECVVLVNGMRPEDHWGARGQRLYNCKNCCGTHRDPLPWSELFRAGRMYF